MRCLISNKSSRLMYIVLEPHTFFEISVVPSCEKLISAFERSLITLSVSKLMLEMPVPGRPSDLRPKGFRRCEFMLYNVGKN